jgi:hypothetical protein
MDTCADGDVECVKKKGTPGTEKDYEHPHEDDDELEEVKEHEDHCETSRIPTLFFMLVSTSFPYPHSTLKEKKLVN